MKVKIVDFQNKLAEVFNIPISIIYSLVKSKVDSYGKLEIKIICELTIQHYENKKPVARRPTNRHLYIRLDRRTQLARNRRGYSYRIPESLARTSDRRNAHKYTRNIRNTRYIRV